MCAHRRGELFSISAQLPSLPSESESAPKSPYVTDEMGDMIPECADMTSSWSCDDVSEGAETNSWLIASGSGSENGDTTTTSGECGLVGSAVACDWGVW